MKLIFAISILGFTTQVFSEAVTPTAPAPATTPTATEPAAPAHPEPLPSQWSKDVQLLAEQLIKPSEEGLFAPFDLPKNTENLLIYFSASWCGPCQTFTPKLVQFYQGHQLPNSKMEIVFVSLDSNAKAMQQYMLKKGMPWPAVKFEKRSSLSLLSQIEGPGIPHLVLVDTKGKVLKSSYENGQYIGTQPVLDAAGQLLKK